jgi:Lon protease-like protein
MSDDATSLEGFSGTARLFPLPNLVLFPHVIQPLHIFEPRYRQLMADALNDDRLMAMALLRPGWEEEDPQSPPLHAVVCLGRIFKEERLTDGRYNLLLHGLSRARLVEETPSGKLYRTARVQLLPDVSVPEAEAEQELRRQLGERIGNWFAAQSVALEQLQKLLESNLSIGSLCDIFSFALPLELELKQRLLEEPDVPRRADVLLTHLATHPPPAALAQPSGRKFPPEFSTN